MTDPLPHRSSEGPPTRWSTRGVGAPEIRAGLLRWGLVALVLLLAAPAPGTRQTAADPGIRTGRMELAPGEDTTLTLSAALGSSWAEAPVSDVTIRAGGRQERIPADALPAGATLRIAGPDGGCSLVTVRLGRPSPGSSKTVVCRRGSGAEAEARARMAAGAVLMSKTGGAVELRPFGNPATVVPGSDLPVRIYSRAGTPTGSEAVALGPEGRRLRARVDGIGVATFRIDAPGRWTIRHVERQDGRQEMAELHFRTAPESLRQAWRQLVARDRSVAGARLRDAVDDDTWQELGPRPITGRPLSELLFPHAGRVSSIAASHRNRGLLFAGGAGGGVWRTGNGGGRWRSLTDALPTTVIGAVALHPTNHRIVYAGSGEAAYAYHSLYGLGLYRSTNRGRSWEVIGGDTFAGRTFSELAVSRADPDVVFAAVGRAGGRAGSLESAKAHPDAERPVGLFRSGDGGDTWEQVTRGLRRNVAASSVAVDPAGGDRVFVALADVFGHRRNGIYRSDDGGRSFRSLGGGLPDRDAGHTSLAVAPSDPDRVYALITREASRDNPGGFAPRGADVLGFYRSDDGGDAWERVGPTTVFDTRFQFGAGYYYNAVAVHPGDPDVVFAGGVDLLRSTDGGRSWTVATPPHVDIHDITFDAAGRLLVADDGGVHRSTDLGDTWVQLNGIGTIQFYPGMSFTPDAPGRLLAGTQDNGTVLRVEGEWQQVFGGDGGFTAFDPDDPDVLFYEFQGTGNLFRSPDAGFTSDDRSTGIDPNDRTAFQAPFLFDPGDPSRMLYATQRIYESTNRGASWTAISGDLTGGAPAAVRSLAMAPSDPDFVYAGTNDGRVQVSRDGGRTWTRSLTGIVGWPRVEREIAVDPRDPQTALLAAMRFGDDRLLMTRDAGASWVAVDGGLPDVPVNTAAIHGSGNGRALLAGTDAGVWISDDDGVTWSRLGGDLPRVPVMDLRVDTGTGTLWAATLGRGAWSIRLPD